MTESQMQLKSHIEAQNAAIAAWVAESPTTRFGGQMVDDVEFWAKDGITSVAEFIHYGLVSSVFETTRSLMGYKPSWSDLKSMTDEELTARLAQLQTWYDQSRESEEAEIESENAYRVWQDAFDAQQAWENPSDEIFFKDGAWCAA
jgi:hypothetical protein